MDLVAPTGTALFASAGGRAVQAGPHGGYGNAIQHCTGVITRYGHTSKMFVKVGALIMPGQKIAEVGSTGRLDGAALALRGGHRRHAGQSRSVSRALQAQIRHQGSITGNVNAYDIVINGTLNGDVTVEHFVELRSNAHVNGNIYYQQLRMDVGASVEEKLAKRDNTAVQAEMKRLSSEVPSDYMHSQT